MLGAQVIEGMEGVPLLRPDEVARMLRLSKPRIYQLARDGHIPFCRFDKSIRFVADDVREFVRSHRCEKREP